jgi:hypothetical protein
MFRFSHTTAGAEDKAIKAVFTSARLTTPVASHFNTRSADPDSEVRLSANQIAFKLSTGASREYGELKKAKAAIAQHKKYQDHMATTTVQVAEASA